MFKKLTWLLKRHPFLYRTRFKLLSKQVTEKDIDNCNYNNDNPKNKIPAIYWEKNREIFHSGMPTSDFEKVKTISIWLQDNVKGGPGLSQPSDTALKMMLKGEGGVCSDFAQVFNNFCVINDIKVREWGTTRIPFTKEFGGHSFNEVFIAEWNQWMMIDVYYCLWFKDLENNKLSTLGYFKSQRLNVIVNAEMYYPNKRLESKTLERNYYKSGLLPFVICRYDNKNYDILLKNTRSWLPVFISHFLMVVIGKTYHYRFPLDNPSSLYR
ncbi:transglutaminase-like domain-containing protein [Aegicerativicinus sediminis]|uniref:transglutaminase-like domain-containing protein n=1 Tax=Aegicerativicinus sediminis TaxID=2893202 RepID=UPI001E2C9403|nr:transglutaminase-like domain-containing protein [Aegicerativicinus sediminis]